MWWRSSIRPPVSAVVSHHGVTSMHAIALTSEDLALFRELDAIARQRGRNVDHAEAYRVLKGLADSRPIDLSGRMTS